MTTKTAKKSASAAGVKAAHRLGSNETLWTTVASVPVERGIMPCGEGPLFLNQHIGNGKMGSGKNRRKFNVAMCVIGGDLIVHVDSKTCGNVVIDKSRTYVLKVHALCRAIADAEFPLMGLGVGQRFIKKQDRSRWQVVSLEAATVVLRRLSFLSNGTIMEWRTDPNRDESEEVHRSHLALLYEPGA